MRHVLELLDGDVARVYSDLGVPDYRPRYSPVVRALVERGPLSIRELASAVGVTHSAASQTAAQMARHGLLTLERGADARQRIAWLTERARALLSMLGSSMTSFAVVLQVWDLSRSSLAVGLLGLTFVPVLLAGLLGGSAADVVDRRKLALVTSTCLMAVSAVFAAQAYAG